MRDLLELIKNTDVEWEKLEELGSFYGGLSGKTKNDFTGGKAKYITYMNVFSNYSLPSEIDSYVNIGELEKQNTINYGDIIFTGSSESYNEAGLTSVQTTKTSENIYLNSFCFGFRFNNPEMFDPEFLKHLFRSDSMRFQIKKTANGVTRFNVSKKKMGRVSIPIIPLEIQHKVARALDNFTELTEELTAELTTELTDRKKQYEYYRDELFGKNYTEMLSKCEEKNVDVSTLESLGKFTRGKRFVRTDIKDRGVPCIHYGDLYTHYGISADSSKYFLDKKFSERMRFAKKGDIVIVQAGENDMDIGIGVAWMGNQDVVVHDACYIFEHNMNPKYISYFLRTNIYHLQIKKYVSRGKICSITSEKIGMAKIPLPPLEEQQRIVTILDKFDTLVNDLSSGLTAEIEMRNQQYEYYRKKIFDLMEG